MAYEVELLESAATFIQTLPLKMRAKIFRTIELLEQFGHHLPEPHAKSLKGWDGLKELRVKQASDICRLFYFHYNGKTYVVTSGYVKKERKTNRQELKKALALKKQFEEENHDD